MHSFDKQGSLLIAFAAAANIGGAILVSVLQVWSASAATPLEYIVRPLLAVLANALLVRGLAWARWPVLILAAATAIWLVGSAATATILAPPARVFVAVLGLLVLATGVLPWHQAAASTLRRRRGASANPEAAA